MRLQELAVLSRFSAGMPGDTRQDKKLTEEVKEDKHLGHQAGKWMKQLYPKQALEKIKGVVGRAREKHWELTLPWDDTGYRILPTTTYLDYQQVMRGLRQEFEAAREEFNAKWDEWVKWAQNEHNSRGVHHGSRPTRPASTVASTSEIPTADLQKKTVKQLRDDY